MPRDTRLVRLRALHRELDGCRACPKMIGPVVHGPPVLTKVFLLGQAPGPREGNFGRPFAWTAGRTLFKWFEDAMGLDEASFRDRIYMAAVARCFPGKAKGGGDRKPDADEIVACRTFLEREVHILEPELVIAVGTLAIGEVLREQVAGKKLDEIIGRTFHTRWHDADVDVVPLPHPSGASPWPRIEPGKTLLGVALEVIARHPSMKPVLSPPSATGQGVVSTH